MYKARSASYQRGMGRNSGDRLTPADREKFTKTQISTRELDHFSFGERTRGVTLDRLEPLLRGYAKNGIKTPKDVALLLNREGVKTACGELWTPQLVWFLQGFLFERRELRRAASAHRPLKTCVKRSTPPNPRDRLTLTVEDMAHRLSVLGRIARSD